MYSLTAAMIAAIGRPISEPGLFLQMGFNNGLRWHDRQGTKSWNALSWTPLDMVVSDFKADTNGLESVTLQIVDSDNAIATLCRSQTRAISVKIWYYDASALAVADPKLMFDGVLDHASAGDDRRIKIACALQVRNLPDGLIAQVIPSYMLSVADGAKIYWGVGVLTILRPVVNN